MNATEACSWLGLVGLEGLTALPSQLTAVPAALTACICITAIFWLLSSPGDDFSKLPGPPPDSWLLGSLKQVSKPQAHRFFQVNTQKYGGQGLWRFRLAHMRIVVLSSPEAVLAVVGRGSDLPKAAAMYDSVDELFSPKGHRSFFNTHDYDAWKLVRKATAPAFSLDNIRKAFPRLLEVANELCNVLSARAAAGQEADVAEAAMRVTLDVIGITGFGHDFNARAYSPCELFEVIPPLLAEFTLRGTDPSRRLLHRLLPFLPDARAYNRCVKACHRWWNVLLQSVRATNLAAADAAKDTSLRVCLATLPLSDDLLLPQIAVYLVAGFETTAHSIAWTLYELAANPGVQAKVEAELAGAGLLGPGARPLEFTDLSLPFLGAVVKEAMRLHPVASLGTIRQADRWVELCGYRLAPGTILWAPLISLHTNTHLWERAEEFWPERWEQGSTAAAAGPSPAGPPKAYLPFSDGPRDCIGQNLALMEARAVVALVVGRFRLSVAPRMGDRQAVRDAEVMKLTLQCKSGIWLQLEPRS